MQVSKWNGLPIQLMWAEGMEPELDLPEDLPMIWVSALPPPGTEITGMGVEVIVTAHSPMLPVHAIPGSQNNHYTGVYHVSVIPAFRQEREMNSGDFEQVKGERSAKEIREDQRKAAVARGIEIIEREKAIREADAKRKS